MKNGLIFFTLIQVVFMFDSCSIIKKRYSHGFHLEWNSRKNYVNSESKGADKLRCSLNPRNEDISDKTNTIDSTKNYSNKFFEVKKTKCLTQGSTILNSNNKSSNSFSTEANNSILLANIDKKFSISQYEKNKSLINQIILKRQSPSSITALNKNTDGQEFSNKLFFNLFCFFAISGAILMIIALELLEFAFVTMANIDGFLIAALVCLLLSVVLRAVYKFSNEGESTDLSFLQTLFGFISFLCLIFTALGAFSYLFLGF